MSLSARPHPLPTRAASLIPLDPTAEAAAVSAAYTESRVARLLAVRLQAKADAALARQSFAEAKRKEESQIAAQRAFEAEVEAAKHAAALARQLAQAEQQLGEAQRNAAHEAEVQAQRREAAEARKRQLDSNASARFDQALSKVQQRSQAARAAKEERAALKEASKQAEKLVRAQIERAALKAANQTPKHLLEYQRMTSPGYTPRPNSASAPAAAVSAREQAAAASMHVSGRATSRARSSIPGGLSPATPLSVASTPAVSSAAAIAADAGSDDDESPALPLAAIPTPHPHPASVRKHVFNVKPQPATPKIAVALNFSSPAPVPIPATQLQPLAERAAEQQEKEEEKQQPAAVDPAVARAQEAADASKQAQLLVAHDRVLSNARLHRARGGYKSAVTSPPSSVSAAVGAATTRNRQEKAFEIVMKQGKEIVSERIGTGAEVPLAPATGRASSNKKQRPTSADAAKSPPNAASAARRPTSARSVARTPRSSSHKNAVVVSTRKRPAKPVPILVPNAAFFAALQQQNLASADATAAAADLFNPQITVGSDTPSKKGLAWIIPLATIDAAAGSAAADDSCPQQPAELSAETQPTAAPSVPALRGLHLVAQLEKQRNDRMAAQEAALQLTSSPAAAAPAAAATASTIDVPAVEFGSRYFAPQNAVSEQIIQQHEQELQERAATVPAFSPPRRSAPASAAGSSEVFSSPLFPLASAAAAKVADAARAATPRAQPAPQQQQPKSAARSSSSTPAVDLDRQLRSILAQHLKHDATATKLIFSPQPSAATAAAGPQLRQQHAPAGVFCDDSDFSDSDDDESGAAAVDQMHLPLASFTSPAAVAAYSASSAASTPSSPPFSRASVSAFTPCSPLTPLAASLVSSDPTSATDLFIEQIHYVLAQEAEAKRAVDRIIEEARRQRSPAPAPAPATATSLAEEQEQQKENTQPKIEAAAPAPNLLSPTAFLHQQPQHSLLTPSSKLQQLQQLITPSQHLASVPATPASAGGANSSFVPSSVDRKALLHAFSSLSADELLAAKPTRTHNLFGSSIPPTPSDASFMHTPMRSPQQPQQQQLLATPPRRLQASFDSMH